MSLLKVMDLSQAYMDKVLYDCASFELFKGEHIGVVGQNGAGKSTLIRILMGEVVPDKGMVKWQANVKIGYLDQYVLVDETLSIWNYLCTAFYQLYEKEKEMNRLYEESAITGDDTKLLKASKYQEELVTNEFYEIDSRIRKVISGLGIDAIGIEKMLCHLSGGQKAKVILAKLLLEDPQVLLLDEPTNYLDKEHVEWLSAYLCEFQGGFITVSHDFDFLEKIATGILDIEFGTIKKYHGSYSQFLNQKIHLREDYIRQYHAQQKKIEQTEDYIRKNKAGVNSKMARGRQKQLDRVERIAPPSFQEKPVVNFKEIELNVQDALTVTGLEVGYYFSLIPRLSFHVRAGQKLVITGFNGIGKSTLLKTLVGMIPPLAGKYEFSDQVKIGYYEQELNWEDSSRTPFQLVGDYYPGMNKKEIRRALAQCGVKNDHAIQEIGTLSGGEQSKVKLCLMILTPCNFLILDEPTNHFDAQTKDALILALRNFKGSIIVVSHEEKFYRDWADKVIQIESGLL